MTNDKNQIRFFLKLIKTFKMHIIILGLIGVIWSVFTVVKAYILKIIIDSLVKNGIECLKKLRMPDVVDLVLLDIMMPEMDGYQTLREIRVDECLKHIPVISLTAQAMKGDRNKSIEAGANDYCSKPIDMAILLLKIKMLLKL